MSNRKIALTLALMTLSTVAIILFGCSKAKDETGPKDTYNDNFNRQSLLLIQTNHTEGWGRADCLMCHPLINIPRHTGREESQCMGCHGDNGTNMGNNLCLTCHQTIINNRQHNAHLTKFNFTGNQGNSFATQSTIINNIKIPKIESFNPKGIIEQNNQPSITKERQLKPASESYNKSPAQNSYKELGYFDYCFICHADSGVGSNNHLNGHADVRLSEEYGGSWNGQSCSGTFCHGNSSPDWNSSAELTCKHCHKYKSGSAIDFVSGKHNAHVIDGGLDCSVCHKTYPSTHLNFTFDNPDNIVPDSGTYTDKTPNGYSKDGSSGSCSGMTSPCHSGEAQWQSGFSCGTCHGISSSNPPQSGSHIRHAGSDSGRSYSCSICHYKLGYGTPSHLNGKNDAGFDTTSLAGDNNPEYNDSRCFNLYCHGAGKRALPAGTNYSPTWGDPSTSYCGSCHGASTTTPPSSGKHPLHVGTMKFQCETCHYATIEIDFEGNMPNGKLDVVFSPTFPNASYTYGDKPNAGTCLSVGCHNDRSWEEHLSL